MKKQNKSAIFYLLHNFFGIAMFSAIPAVVLGFGSYAPLRADFLAAEFRGQIAGDVFMQQLLKSFFIYKFDHHILLIFVGALLAIFAASLLLAKVSRHMRLGVNTNKGLLGLSFEIFFKVLLFFALFFLVAIVLDLLVIGLMYFVNFLNFGLWRSAILIFLYCVSDLFFSYLLAMLSLTLPMVVEEGYRLNVAMSYSARLMASSGKKFVLKFMIFYLLSRIAIVSLCAVVDLLVVRAVFCSLFYFVWLSLIIPLFCDKYISTSQGERRDIKQTLF